MANIWDRFGRLIGSVERSGNGDADTYDEKGQPLGRVTKLGTYEIRGNKISSERDPGANIREKEVAQETSKKVGIGTRLVEVKPKWGGGDSGVVNSGVCLTANRKEKGWLGCTGADQKHGLAYAEIRTACAVEGQTSQGCQNLTA